MVGLGETEEQIGRLLDDVLAVGCDILTIASVWALSAKRGTRCPLMAFP